MANGTPVLFRVPWLSKMIVVGLVMAGCDSTVRQVGRSTESVPIVQTESRAKHTDHTYGFTVKYYPKEYVLLTDDPHQATTQPPTVQRVHFQRKDIAADQEPPGLTISARLIRTVASRQRDFFSSTDRCEGRVKSYPPTATCAQRVRLFGDRPVCVRSHTFWRQRRENAEVIPSAPGFHKGSYAPLI
jgi:hypothetical protein